MSIASGIIDERGEGVWVAVVNKIIFYGNVIKKVNIKVANYEYMVRLWSWLQNFIQFYSKLWNLWFVWWSVNTNDNYGTILWERNLHHTYLIICMTHWKFGHMGRCITISNEHRDAASCLVSTICMKAGEPRTPWQVLAENYVSESTITSAARFNSDAN